MLYICIPAHNEASTLGVLLWRIRKVFQGYSREYEVLVYDDGSSDGTRELLVPYQEVAPLTVLKGDTRVGYGKALEALAREASRRTRYPRRDAMIVMQADFTDQPEHLPEIVKRFEGGADIVVAERGNSGEPPRVRRMRQLVAWAQRFSVSLPGISDPFASFRAYRISLLRELMKQSEGDAVITADGWSANLELLLKTLPLARRVESVRLEPRYDLRFRETRIRPFTDALAVFRFARGTRGKRVTIPAPVAAEVTGVKARVPQRERVTS